MLSHQGFDCSCDSSQIPWFPVGENRFPDHGMGHQIKFFDYAVDHRFAAKQFHLGLIKFACLDFRSQYFLKGGHMGRFLADFDDCRGFIDAGDRQTENQCGQKHQCEHRGDQPFSTHDDFEVVAQLDFFGLLPFMNRLLKFIGRQGIADVVSEASFLRKDL
jgi:hypothetical protein